VVTAPDGSCLIVSAACDVLGTDGDDSLGGSSAAEVICGLGGNDVLSGGDGDTLIGGPGDDELDAGPDDCAIADDRVTEEERGTCESVKTYTDAVEESRAYPLPGGNPPPPPPPPPPDDTPRPVGGGGGGPVTQGGPGVVNQTTGAGQVYVALARYLQAGEDEAKQVVEVIAEILESTVNYVDGEIRFLVRCSYAGDARVVLWAVAENGERVKLGEASFHCAGEGDDPVVRVEVSERGRGLIEGSSRVRIQARVIDPSLERQPDGADQRFVLTP
jgi:Ca2+-binding RTX toxin-like protein